METVQTATGAIAAATANTLDLDDLGDLSGDRQPVGVHGYATAKLALLMTGYALARRLDGTGVTVNALHPGVTATGIGDAAAPPLLRPVLRIARAAAAKPALVSTPEHGARTAIFLATAPELAAVTGKDFVDQRERRSPPVAYDTDRQERLWRLSERLVGLAPEAVDAVEGAGARAAPPRASPFPDPAPALPRREPPRPGGDPTVATS